MRLHWYTYEVPVRLPTTLVLKDVGRWQILLRPWPWHWGWRWAQSWPLGWLKLPAVKGRRAPIFVWWHVGPVEVRHYRWREGSDAA